jgi:hypothetical protein
LPADGAGNCRSDRKTKGVPGSWRSQDAPAAFVGTILMTALLVWNFVFAIINVLRDLVPAVTLLSSVIYAFGSLTVAVFFYVFHRAA